MSEMSEAARAADEPAFRSVLSLHRMAFSVDVSDPQVPSQGKPFFFVAI